MLKPSYRICAHCVMDDLDPDIWFNENGVCNYCIQAESLLKKVHFLEDDSKKILCKLAQTIKSKNKNGSYDCVIGLSGGVDSSYVAYLVKEIGLNPLAVHFDNGWNSETAVSNIKNLVNKLNIDLTTYVVNWEEFKDLQRAFIKASVVDIEIVTDFAIIGALLKFTKEHNIRYIIGGNNIATEHGMPRSWNWHKRDTKNIKSIHKLFGTRPIRSFPMVGLGRWFLIKYIGIPFQHIEILDLINYRKDKAMQLLTEKLGWQYYGGKHYESIFTKFYQAYILPQKFRIDKRKVHLSALIRNGEISREDALADLKKLLYDPIELRNDKEYFLKKLEFTEAEFDEIMRQSPKPHDFYPSNIRLIKLLQFLKRMLGSFKIK